MNEGGELVTRTGLNHAWRDFELMRGVLNDSRLKPANLYQEVAGALSPNGLSGRGVGPRVRHQVDEWFSANAHRVPGLTFRGRRNRHTRLAAIDLRLLLGYASNVLDHAREVIERGYDIEEHLHRNAPRIRLSKPIVSRLKASIDEDESWPKERALLAKRIVSRILGLKTERTITRHLKADPKYEKPSIFAWAAHYHLHSLNTATND